MIEFYIIYNFYNFLNKNHRRKTKLKQFTCLCKSTIPACTNLSYTKNTNFYTRPSCQEHQRMSLSVEHVKHTIPANDTTLQTAITCRVIPHTKL